MGVDSIGRVGYESHNAEALASLGNSRRRPAILAGGHSRQRDKLPPAKRLAGSGKLLGNGSIVLFGVQCSVFADGIAQEPVEDGPRRLIKLAQTISDRTGARLVVGPDGPVKLIEQRLRAAFSDRFEIEG